MKQAKQFREEVSYQNWHRLKVKILTVMRFGGCLRKAMEDNASKKADKLDRPSRKMGRMSSISSFREATRSFRKSARDVIVEAKDGARAKAERWAVKVRGGGAGIPPSFTYRQCMWTFLGVIITHTVLSRINLLIQEESDGDLSLVLAPLGEIFVCIRGVLT